MLTFDFAQNSLNFLFSNKLKLKGLKLKLGETKALLFIKKREEKKKRKKEKEKEMVIGATSRLLLSHMPPWDDRLDKMNPTKLKMGTFGDRRLPHAPPNHNAPTHMLVCIQRTSPFSPPYLFVLALIQY